MPTLKPTPRVNPNFPRSIQRVIPSPEGMEWEEWVQIAVGMNGRLGLPNLIDPNPDWREFAERLAMHVPDAPYHDTFSDWREWAMNLRAALAL